MWCSVEKNTERKERKRSGNNLYGSKGKPKCGNCRLARRAVLPLNDELPLIGAVRLQISERGLQKLRPQGPDVREQDTAGRASGHGQTFRIETTSWRPSSVVVEPGHRPFRRSGRRQNRSPHFLLSATHGLRYAQRLQHDSLFLLLYHLLAL